jgi:TPR repeat protein
VVPPSPPEAPELSEHAVAVERELPSQTTTPATTAASMPVPPDQSPITAGRKLSPEEIKLLMDRGQRFVETGDLTAARLLFRRAAEAGDATAALALGATYDPAIIGKLVVLGVLADVDKSRAWYEKAAALGSPEAARRLGLLADR